MPELTWHRVTDRLPDSTYMRLVTVQGSRGVRYVIHAAYIDGNWYHDSFEPYELPVIAWADWPEPWDGEVEDGPRG
jgi:hypothetical protein